MRRAAGCVTQDLESLIKMRAYFQRGHRAGSTRCELDRQRNAVEMPAQTVNVVKTGLGHWTPVTACDRAMKSFAASLMPSPSGDSVDSGGTR